MFPTKDGKKFGSAYVAKRRDAEKEKAEAALGEKHEASETPEFEAGEQECMKEKEAEGATPSADSVKAEHGPAMSTHVHSDHTSNEHHVISHHKNGHVHHSKHGSAQEAHDMAAALAEGGDQTSHSAAGDQAPESDGFQMPRLA